MNVDLQTFLSVRLENLRPVAGGNGWTSACPICRAEGSDSTRSHLRIYSSAAFSCAKHQGDSDHNKAIRGWVYQNLDIATLASLESAIIDPEPKLEADKVYPEEMLKEMVSDHRYWVGRGISEEVLRRMEGGLHPSDVASKMQNRYLFPCRDLSSGRIIGWIGRLTTHNSFAPKWKNLVKTSRVTYPLTITAEHIKKVKKIVLLESQGDALSLATCGIWCFGVIFGLNFNSRWLGWLAGVDLDEIIISTNNDTLGDTKSKEAGNRAAEKIRDKLIPYFGEDKIRIRLPQMAKDWNDVLLKHPEELIQFKDELENLKTDRDKVYTDILSPSNA